MPPGGFSEAVEAVTTLLKTAEQHQSLMEHLCLVEDLVTKLPLAPVESADVASQLRTIRQYLTYGEFGAAVHDLQALRHGLLNRIRESPEGQD